MNPNNILLSICIPTYNRSSILKKTIEDITNDPDFDDEVEIVISDNNSSDNTFEVVKGFQEKHSNIHYYRNKENVIDKNFTIVLDYGNGAYLKLQNDYIHFAEGAIGFMKEHIRKNMEHKTPLFFVRRVRKKLKKESTISCNSLDDFIYAVSYGATWISNFGCWREDFKKLDDKDRLYSKCLLQVDWAYKIIDIRKKAIVIPRNLFKPIALSKVSRGGYNYFGVFVKNYFDIMDEFVQAGKISRDTYQKDKKYTLIRFRERFVRYLVVPNQKNSFDTGKTIKVLWDYYKEFPFFYLVLFAIGIAFLLKWITWPFRKLFSLLK